jgi:hypothetical protein
MLDQEIGHEHLGRIHLHPSGRDRAGLPFHVNDATEMHPGISKQTPPRLDLESNPLGIDATTKQRGAEGTGHAFCVFVDRWRSPPLRMRRIAARR